MQLKAYQARVLDDFSRFLETIRAEVPKACIKVPTGGGKTFIATCSLKTLFDRDFGNRVEIFDKDQCLQGQNFSPTKAITRNRARR